MLSIAFSLFDIFIVNDREEISYKICGYLSCIEYVMRARRGGQNERRPSLYFRVVDNFAG